jgi:hypothetical protein
LSLRGAKRRSNQVRLPRLLLRRSLAMTINLTLQRPNLSVIASLTAKAVRRGNLGSQTQRFANCVSEANLVFNEKGRIRLSRLPYGRFAMTEGLRTSRLPSKSLASMGIGFQWVIFFLTIYYFQFAILNSLLALFSFSAKNPIPISAMTECEYLCIILYKGGQR